MVAQQQEAIVGENNDVVISKKNSDKLSTNMMMMIKGKRTKRPRPLSPLALTMSSATTTDEGGATSATSEEWAAPHSAATSEEEEDMAHCLILLAQGSNQSSNINNNSNNNMNTITNNKGSNGITSYECKTCNKSFSSFQALGGHRASHKKPKPNVVALSELKKSSSLIFSLINNDNDNNNHHHSLKQYDQHFNDDGTTLTLQIANSTSICTSSTNNTNKAKVHECGICGAEFSSGQALGGHMRRHRPIGMTTSTTAIPIPAQSVTIAANGTPNNVVKDEKMTRNLLSLDLNLPAPEDELHHQHHHHHQRDSSSKFVFSANEKTLVFTAASQLVDCHY